MGEHGNNYGLGAMRQVYYQYGIGFFLQANSRARKEVISLDKIMQSAYLFTNGMH